MHWRAPGAAWATLAMGLALGALAATLAPADALDWQADRLAQVWRWWTAAFVHLSPRHLLANLAGCAVVGAFGWTARVPASVATAWFIAWPMGHVALALVPGLQRYAGLSGVLHAGVAAAALWLLAGPAQDAQHPQATRRARTVGAAVLLGLVAKLLLEAPWRAAVQQVPGWDISIVPMAHVTGAVAGVFCAACAVAASILLLTRRMPR